MPGIVHSAERAFQRAMCALSNGQGAAHPVVPASLFKREVFGVIGYFPENLRAAEDLLWVARYELHYGVRAICPDAQVVYRHFPATWWGAAHKWCVAEYFSVLAGVRLRQQAVFLVLLPLLYVVLLSATAWGALVFSVYLLLRGVVDPMRRSHPRQWWGAHPQAICIAIVMGPCLGRGQNHGDISRLVGQKARSTWASLRMEYDKCDLCRADHHELVARQMYPLHSTMEEVFTIARCVECGLHFTNPRLTPSEIGRYYASGYVLHVDASGWRRLLDRFFDILSNSPVISLSTLFLPLAKRLAAWGRAFIAGLVLRFNREGRQGAFLDISCGGGFHANFREADSALQFCHRLFDVAEVVLLPPVFPARLWIGEAISIRNFLRPLDELRCGNGLLVVLTKSGMENKAGRDA